jgi:hypothetical protein
MPARCHRANKREFSDGLGSSPVQEQLGLFADRAPESGRVLRARPKRVHRRRFDWVRVEELLDPAWDNEYARGAFSW